MANGMLFAVKVGAALEKLSTAAVPGSGQGLFLPDDADGPVVADIGIVVVLHLAEIARRVGGPVARQCLPGVFASKATFSFSAPSVKPVHRVR